jgi:transcriptional regulator with XRE-family HTH domain
MERLKLLRQEKGLSQARLAARAELDPSTVNQIERGAREASTATLRKLADALEVSLYDLLEEEAPKAPAPSPDPEQERRVTTIWRDFVAARVEWCEKMMDKKEGDFNYPFASLDTAIQWAMYVGVESVMLKNTITRAGADISQDLRTLVERIIAVSEQTDARVNAMMQDSALNAEEKEQVHLRLVQEQRSA